MSNLHLQSPPPHLPRMLQSTAIWLWVHRATKLLLAQDHHNLPIATSNCPSVAFDPVNHSLFLEVFPSFLRCFFFSGCNSQLLLCYAKVRIPRPQWLILEVFCYAHIPRQPRFGCISAPHTLFLRGSRWKKQRIFWCLLSLLLSCTSPFLIFHWPKQVT